MVITEVSIVKMPLAPSLPNALVASWLSELAPRSVHCYITLNIAICGRLKLARFNSVLCVVCIYKGGGRERESGVHTHTPILLYR